MGNKHSGVQGSLPSQQMSQKDNGSSDSAHSSMENDDLNDLLSVRISSPLPPSIDLLDADFLKFWTSLTDSTITQNPDGSYVVLVNHDEAKNLCTNLDEVASFLGDVADMVRDKRKRCGPSVSPENVAKATCAVDAKHETDAEQSVVPVVTATEGSTPSSITVLPDDLLVKTFSYLECRDRIRLNRVSPRWRNLLMSVPVVQTVLIDVEKLMEKSSSAYIINYLCKAVKRETRHIVCFARPNATAMIETDSLLSGLDATLDGRARKLKKLRMANLYLDYDAIKHILIHVDRLIMHDVVVGGIATGNYDGFHMHLGFGTISNLSKDRSRGLFDVFNENCPMPTAEQLETLKQHLLDRDHDQGMRMAGYLRRREPRFAEMKSADIDLDTLDLPSLSPVTLLAFRSIFDENYCDGQCCMVDGSESDASDHDTEQFEDSSSDEWTEEFDDDDDEPDEDD